jgi:hypothetical protein
MLFSKSKPVDSMDEIRRAVNDAFTAMNSASKQVTEVCIALKKAVPSSPEYPVDHVALEALTIAMTTYDGPKLLGIENPRSPMNNIVRSLEQVLAKVQQANMATEKWAEAVACAKYLRARLQLRSLVESRSVIQKITELEEAVATACSETLPNPLIPQPKLLNVQME